MLCCVKTVNEKIQKIRKTLTAGDTEKASKMLKWVLKNEPSADAWVLAAEMADSDEQKIALLKHALKLEAQHSTANRMLFKLEGAVPKEIDPALKTEWQRTTGTVSFKEIRRAVKEDRFQRHARRQRFWTRLGCLCGIIFSISFSVAMFRAVGLISSGLSGKFAVLFGRPTPVVEINGTPFDEVEYAPFVMTPSYVEKATGQDIEIMDDGYMHEHYFDGLAGQEYAIYVQFLSVSANNVSRNVVLVDPDEKNAMDTCETGTMLEGNNGITMTCILDKSGRWSVRIVGREGESVGTYFIGVENLNMN